MDHPWCWVSVEFSQTSSDLDPIPAWLNAGSQSETRRLGDPVRRILMILCISCDKVPSRDTIIRIAGLLHFLKPIIGF